MHFSTIIAAALASASLTIGVPTFNGNAKRQASVLCSGLEATPQCCAVNVLNLADLDCADRKSPTYSKHAFSVYSVRVTQLLIKLNLPSSHPANLRRQLHRYLRSYRTGGAMLRDSYRKLYP